MNSKKTKYLPIFFALTTALGFFLGSNLNQSTSSSISTVSGGQELNEVLNYIENEYVDSVDRGKIVDKTISYMLQELDPHSYYISAEEVAAMNEPLEGNFDGIGVQFNIVKDTIFVITPISGGPSEKVGIKAGDRIIKVEGDLVAGVSISNKKVLKLLKGPRGTKVNVTVLRKNEEFDFTITRDEIPIYSVATSQMINDTVGFIKVSRFARTTHEEFVKGVDELKEQGMTKLIIDLRGNGGGYLDAAVNICDELLTEDNLIVFTEGKARPKEEYFATDRTSYPDLELAILIDENSASASEILAGAIQDNDRGVILGRRSFGKGLVQEQTPWPNGAATRLTIARYYTPSGRCIQKPYEEGNESYFEEQYERYENGEMYSQDSIDFQEELKYTTKEGRTVFGGGGIFPDFFVPLDTSYSSAYMNRILYAGVLYDFSLNYADQHRKELLGDYNATSFANTFLITPSFEQQIIELAQEKGIDFKAAQFEKSKSEINKRVKAYIARNIWDDYGFYLVWNQKDPVIELSLKELSQ